LPCCAYLFRRPELGRDGADGRGADRGADGRDTWGRGADRGAARAGARAGADGRDTCGRDGVDGRRFTEGLGADRLGVDGRADGVRFGLVRRSSDGVERRAGAVLGLDERFGCTLRVVVCLRAEVPVRFGVIRVDVGSARRCGVTSRRGEASRCGVAPRVGTVRRLVTSLGCAVPGLRCVGVTVRLPMLPALGVSVRVGLADGVTVRRPSVIPQPEGCTRRPVSAWG
jgi:hypothetical protein